VDIDVEESERRRVGEEIGYANEINGRSVTMLSHKPHRVASDRIVHYRRTVVEIVEVVVKDAQIGLRYSILKILSIDGNDFDMASTRLAEHVERQDKRVVIPAKVPREVGEEVLRVGRSAPRLRGGRVLGTVDGVKVPIGRR